MPEGIQGLFSKADAKSSNTMGIKGLATIDRKALEVRVRRLSPNGDERRETHGKPLIFRRSACLPLETGAGAEKP
jgi:hypothetical protein